MAARGDRRGRGRMVVDAVALDDDGEPIAVASCKWTGGKMAVSEKDKLEVLAAHLRAGGEPPALYLFSRSGFEQALVEEATANPRLRLTTPAEMWGPSLPPR